MERGAGMSVAAVPATWIKEFKKEDKKEEKKEEGTKETKEGETKEVTSFEIKFLKIGYVHG